MPPRLLPAVVPRRGITALQQLAIGSRLASSTTSQRQDASESVTPRTTGLRELVQDKVLRPMSQDRNSNLRRIAVQSNASKNRTSALERLQHRKWRVGEVYAPHDLSSAEQQKWAKYRPPPVDVVDLLGLDPIAEYKNFSIVSDFMTQTGRIKHRADTSLRAKNQRKVAKMVRRAVAMGLMSSTHHHPVILDARVQYYKALSHFKQSKSAGASQNLG